MATHPDRAMSTGSPALAALMLSLGRLVLGRLVAGRLVAGRLVLTPVLRRGERPGKLEHHR